MVENVIIITPSLLDFSTGQLKIGGLETYIKDLALLCKKNSCKVIVYQCTDNKVSESFLLDGILVKPLLVTKNLQKSFDVLYRENNNSSIFIIATDQMDIKSCEKNVITIQHGIAFDIPGNLIKGFWSKNSLFQHINKFLRCIKNVRRLYNTCNTVCVDYNYYNWFRTLGTITDKHLVTVIPNYTSGCLSNSGLDVKLSKSKDLKSIVFARRFVEYRGTLMFANAVKRLLEERNNVEVTFAGAGPLKENIEKMFMGDDRVHFSSFNASESLEFHKSFDIAVVPTIFSEGTSLSLCEAMAAGCLGISTHVGGLTNILIDNYNGYLCSPSEDCLYETLTKALDLSPAEFDRIVRRGYDTVVEGFSQKLWGEKWMKMIQRVSDEA